MAIPHIFFVDDDNIACTFVSTRLEHCGFNVSCAHNGQESLQFLKENTPDLIILDLIMPGMGGYDVLEKIRANKATKHIQVIILTAREDENDKAKGVKMGVDDYITKPYVAEEFVARISAVLKKAKSAQGKK